MQQCGDPDTLTTLLACHKDVKKVFDTYNDMLEHGYYTQARAASQQVSHRGTGDANLIELEVCEMAIILLPVLSLLMYVICRQMVTALAIRI